MKIACPCCGNELTPEERLAAIQELMIAIDEGMLFGMEDKEIKAIVHQAIDLSDLGGEAHAH